MSYFWQFILWTFGAILMVACCIGDIIIANWLGLGISVVAFVLDTANAVMAFKRWRQWRKRK